MNKSSFGFDKPEDSAGFLLWQTTITWQRLIKAALDPHQTSHSQFVILALLLWFEETKQEPIQAVIVNLTKLDKMTVSKALKVLVDKNLVERNEHTQDTRAKSVCLTNKGRGLIKKLVPIVEAIDDKFFRVIKKNERQSLLQFLRCLAV